MSNDWEDEIVGYARPPSWTKFRKGQSGNPKGRPKRADIVAPPSALSVESEADNALRTELNRKLPVTQAGKTTKISMLDAVVKAQLGAAVKGNVIAQRDVMNAARALEIRDAGIAQAHAQAIEAERARQAADDKQTYDYVVSFKAERAAIWEQAIRDGKTEPDNPWPHPDDILIDEENEEYRIRGPLRKRDVLFYKHSRLLRDAYFAQSVLYYRTRRPSRMLFVEFYTLVWQNFDVSLPKRWQIADGRNDIILYYLLTIPIRELRRDWFERDLRRAAEMRAFLPNSSQHDKEVYREVNKLMKPLLMQQGYRSLAQFERAYEETDGIPRWLLIPK